MSVRSSRAMDKAWTRLAESGMTRRGLLIFWQASAWLLLAVSAVLGLWGAGQARQSQELREELSRAKARASMAEHELRQAVPAWRR